MTEKAKILVVEDETIGAESLRQSLEFMGYNVIAVINTGEDVIETIEKEQTDLIVMDISLQGKIDGIKASEEIHTRFDIPVIYLTAHAESELFERAKETAPYAFLTKPIEVRQLHYAIEIALRKHDLVSGLKRSEMEINNLNNELQKTNAELIQEIGKCKKKEIQLRHQAYHDSLTGLPNRILLFDRIKQAFAFEERHKSLLALILLDLDDFKVINDTMGHSAGDTLLKEVAQRLRKCIRQYDTVGRIGGDEFVIAVNDIQNIHDIIKFAEKVKGIFREPFDIHGHPTHITASLGVSLYPINATDIETLLQMADVAMYVAKKSGKNSFRFFSESMDITLSSRNIVKKMLRSTKFRNTALSEFSPQLHVAPRKGQNPFHDSPSDASDGIKSKFNVRYCEDMP